MSNLEQLALIVTPKMGSRIRVIRKSKGILQHELAERLGLDQPNISRLERRGAPLSTIPVSVWCEALGVGPEELLENVQNGGIYCGSE